MKKLQKLFVGFMCVAVMLATAPNTLTVNAATKNTVKTSVSKVESKAKSIKVTWKEKSSVKGYQVQYSTSSKFKKSATKTKTIKNKKTKSVTIKNLKGCNKKYYVRVRTYKVVNGKKVYSSWSKAKNVKTLNHQWKNSTCKVCGKIKSNSASSNSTNSNSSANYHGKVYTGGSSSKRYHYEAECAGKYSHEITWDEVSRRGLTPCGNCVEK